MLQAPRYSHTILVFLFAVSIIFTRAWIMQAPGGFYEIAIVLNAFQFR